MRVVCIKNNVSIYSWRGVIDHMSNYVVKGQIYTVVGTDDFKSPISRECIPVYLLAEVAPPQPYLLGFPQECFRPVKETKTDISIFKEILNKTPKEVKELIDG